MSTTTRDDGLWTWSATQLSGRQVRLAQQRPDCPKPVKVVDGVAWYDGDELAAFVARAAPLLKGAGPR